VSTTRTCDICKKTGGPEKWAKGPLKEAIP
jgi:hypothetical protein